MAKAKIVVDGNEMEVELPQGYLSPEEVEEAFVPVARHTGETKRLKDRLKALEGFRDPEELIGDEDFLGRVVETHGKTLAERLGVKGHDPAEMERLQNSLRDREVKPLREELGKKDEEIQVLRLDRLEREVVEAAMGNGVEEGIPELLRSYYRSRTRWDDEHRGWFVVGPDGEFEMTDTPKKGRPPYRTVEEDLAAMRKAGTKKAWFKPEARGGAGFKGAGHGSAAEQDIDAAIAEAEKAGDRALVMKLKVQKGRQAGVR